ncbi:MAG: hypothetical protein J0I34_07375 [Pseudonocardia sp.]|uniref:hypothetical protein n=1 Tax=Actinomycetes TaxID=1760 RepID=UPI00086B657A|nr:MULTISPECIES: hypothetical protein [Actinomycetes]MBN9108588.1 hypothetical protein [Pseudonocardia sp.]ODU27467.1 MAG: hypothetical protein ABS80_03560 [Pseudonocardia sp. SCN 72-51]ODV07771.1 MAG: hypothetical protein ABT15_06760 [Pseudonocardia sp. SCN 73-27]
MTPDVVETAAQVLHDRRHRAGTGQVCDECRDLVRAIADVLDVPRLTAIETRLRDAVDGGLCPACHETCVEYVLRGERS